MLEVRDDRVERLGVEEAALDQHRFDRGDTCLDRSQRFRMMRVDFTSIEVRAEAERAATPPTVYTEIRLVYRVGGNVSHKAVEDAVRLSEEKYCSVAAMLHNTVKISYVIEYAEK